MHIVLQRTAELVSLGAHPENHVGQNNHGQKHGGSFEDLLRPTLKLCAQYLEHDGHSNTGHQSRHDAAPDTCLPVQAADLSEIHQNNPYNQGCFQALP